MSIKGQSTDQSRSDMIGLATGILLFFLINLVAIAAFLATAAQAAADGAPLAASLSAPAPLPMSTI